MRLDKKLKYELKHHHLIHWIGLPLILIGSDLFIGFYGHYAGKTGQALSPEAFIAYVCDGSHYAELAMVLVVAIIITLTVEWIVQSRIKHHKKH